MQIFRRARLLLILAVFMGAPNICSVGKARTTNRPITATSSAGSVIACRVLDAWKVKEQGVGIAVFHQAHHSDGPALGQWLRRRDGGRIEFQTPDGKWRSASVLRAGSCFGRGILVYPYGSARLAKREIIQVSFKPKH